MLYVSLSHPFHDCSPAPLRWSTEILFGFVSQSNLPMHHSKASNQQTICTAVPIVLLCDPAQSMGLENKKSKLIANSVSSTALFIIEIRQGVKLALIHRLSSLLLKSFCHVVYST
jgi:hypothetical protein